MFPPGSTDISKNGSVWIATSSPVIVPYTPVELERLRDVDGDDLRVPVRRADEVDVAHPVPAHVVEERAEALHEPLVLAPRDRLPDEALLEGLRLLLLDDGAHFAPFPAATTASTMFT